jgi:hypothetical protein
MESYHGLVSSQCAWGGRSALRHPRCADRAALASVTGSCMAARHGRDTADARHAEALTTWNALTGTRERREPWANPPDSFNREQREGPPRKLRPLLARSKFEPVGTLLRKDE